MSTVRKLLVTACAVTLLAGCSDDASDTSAEATGTEGTGSEEQAVTIAVTPSTTTLVDAGAEPRREIRFDDVDGETQNVDLVTTSTVLQQIDDGEQQDFSTPELTLPLAASTSTTNTEDEADDATRAIDLVIGAASSSDERLTDALSASDGSTAQWSATDTGAVTALQITPAQAALDTARAAIERSLNAAVYRSVDFPAEAVGIGAVWTIDQQVLSGITLNQRTTVTVREIDGDRVELDVEITQTPESSVWTLPDDAGTLNIATYDFSGNGTLEIDLNSPLPIGGSITAEGNQVYTDPESTTVLRQDAGDSITWMARRARRVAPRPPQRPPCR